MFILKLTHIFYYQQINFLTRITATAIVSILTLLEQHHIQQEGSAQQQNTFMQRTAFREDDSKGISISELNIIPITDKTPSAIHTS